MPLCKKKKYYFGILMSIVLIPTNFNIELEFETADFGKRLFAFLIDALIKFIYILIINKLLISIIAINPYDQWGLMMTLYMPMFLYDLLFEIYMNGQSPGKKIMSLRVVRDDGGRPSISQYVLRWLLRIADFTFTFGLGAIFSVALNKYNKRLGDLAAGTIVISTRHQTSIDETVFVEVENQYKPTYSNLVMQLNDTDINTIKRALDKNNKKGNNGLLSRIAEKVALKLQIPQQDDSRYFLEKVIKDYNYYSQQ